MCVVMGRREAGVFGGDGGGGGSSSGGGDSEEAKQILNPSTGNTKTSLHLTVSFLPSFFVPILDLPSWHR